MTPLGLSVVVWAFMAALLLFLSLVAAGYVMQLVRDAKRLAGEVADAGDRLRAAGDEVRFEVERASDHASHIRDVARAGKEQRRRPTNPGGID